MQLEVYWSPVGQCWRVEDGELFTYYDLDLVIGHLKDRGATALVVPPPHSPKTAELVRALERAGIPYQYAPV